MSAHEIAAVLGDQSKVRFARGQIFGRATHCLDVPVHAEQAEQGQRNGQGRTESDRPDGALLGTRRFCAAELEHAQLFAVEGAVRFQGVLDPGFRAHVVSPARERHPARHRD
ncbi:MAG: hypothetical protein ABUL62_25060 [Myxococcales bacterium]